MIEKDLQIYFLTQSFETTNNNIKIIQTNTKTRRLGYLNLILNLFRESSYFPIYYLPKRIELEAIKLNDLLINYKTELKFDDKGAIKETKTGNSAKPYIDLLINLNLITQSNNSFILTKQAKVYTAYSKQSDNYESNTIVNSLNFSKTGFQPFNLSFFETLFYLHNILLNDNLYFTSLLELIKKQEGDCSLRTIKEAFQNEVLEELEKILYSIKTPHRIRKDAQEIKKRILSWTKVQVYLEHIIEPRLNWLLDLRLINNEVFQEKKISLSQEGEKMLNVLNLLNERFNIKSLNIDSFLDNGFFKSLNYIFDVNATNSSLEIKKYLIKNYIDESFHLFKTDAPNRIAASQAILYTCYKSLIFNRVILEFDLVKNFLLSKDNQDYSMDWFRTERDGAISKRK